MDGNLCNGFYRVREKLFNTTSEKEAIQKVRSKVSQEIENGSIPQNLRYLTFKITNVCNSACKYCTHSVLKTKGGAKDIPIEIVLSTIQGAGELGTHVLAINGGEPLTRPDILKIIEEVVRNGITPVLMTNGLLLPKYWQRLDEIGAWYIIISFDSTKREIYEKQRGVSFDDALAGIDAATAFKKRNLDAEISVSVTLTKYNTYDLVETIKYMTNRGIPVQICPFHNYSPDQIDSDFSDVDNERIREVAEKLIEMKRENYLISASSGFIKHLPDFFIYGKKVPDCYSCKIGYTSLFIDCDLSVHACWDSSFESLGYIDRDSIVDIWHGEKMDGYRKRMLSADCKGCWYMCCGEVEMFINNELD